MDTTHGLTADLYQERLLKQVGPAAALTWQAALSLCRQIKQLDGRAFLVGGAVRDELLGQGSKDFDLEVYNLEPDKLLALAQTIGKVKTVGKSFGIYKTRVGELDLDIALPRLENKVGLGHRDFTVTTDPQLSLEQASRRRDFTVNTLFKDLLTGKILDCHNGLADLKNKVLRLVDPQTFGEDPLRALRAVRLASQLGFTVEAATKKAVATLGPQLRYLSQERINEELTKILLSDHPTRGLNLGQELVLWPHCLPELGTIKNWERWDKTIPADPEHRYLTLIKKLGRDVGSKLFQRLPLLSQKLKRGILDQVGNP